MISSLKTFIEKNLALLAFLISFTLSPWAFQPWRIINSDGIFYLHLAYMVNTQGLFTALSHYDWPFLPIIIASFHQLTHLSYATSAYLLNAIFMGFSALFFVKIIEQLRGNVLVQWLAILVFLSFETIINYRANIFRDLGYWAFYLSAIYYLLRYISDRRLEAGLLWFFSSIIALLFRVEGLALFLCSPLIILFLKNFSVKDKITAYAKLYFPLIACVPFIIGFVAYAWFYHDTLFTSIPAYLNSVLHAHLTNIPLLTKLEYQTSQFRKLILPKAAKDGSAQIILFSGLTIYFIYKFVWSLGLLNFLLMFATWKKKLLQTDTSQRKTLYWLLLITLLIPYVFLIQNQFVSTRYLVSAAITGLIFAPFALAYCFTHLQQKLSTLFSNRSTNEYASKSNFFTLKNFVIIYLLIAVVDFAFLGYEVFYEKPSTMVKANIWLYKHKARRANLCSNEVWPVWIVGGENIINAKYARLGDDIPQSSVDSTLDILVQPSSHCQYIAYIYKPSAVHDTRLKRLYTGWSLQKSFVSKNNKNNIYIFARKHRMRASSASFARQLRAQASREISRVSFTRNQSS